MPNSISFRLTLANLVSLLLILGIVGSTAVVLLRQSDDGLVLNLSGRQRMLTQRMTHQLLGYAALQERGRDTQAQRAAVLTTMQVFEKTLEALDHGGPAPLDLQLVNVRNTPPASAAVSDQLRRVRELYQKYRAAARDILDGADTARTTGEQYIIDNNTELLSEMNSAVFLMQAEAEGRVRQLYYVQGGAAAIALLVFLLLSSQVRRTVVEPLRRLNDVSESISRGDVHRLVVVEGPREVVSLATSVERLRLAMKNLLPNPEVDRDFAQL